MRNFLCFIFLFSGIIIFQNNASSQTAGIDSIRHIIQTEKDDKKLTAALNEYAYLVYRSHPDSAIILAEQALGLALKNNDHKEINSSYNVMGLASQVKGTYQLAIKNYQQALEYEKYEGSKLDKGKLYHNMALTYVFMKNKTEILKNELKALQIFAELKDSIYMATTYETLGNYYREEGEFASAENYILKAIDIYENNKSIRLDISLSNVAGAYISYGNLLQVSGRLEEAIKQHKKAITLMKETDDRFNTAIALENLGDDYLASDEFESAYQQYQQAKSIFHEINSPTDVGYELYKMASALNGLEKFAQSIAMLDTALQIFTENKADAYRQMVYDLYYKTYELMGDTKNALSYYKKTITLKDSLNTEAQQNELMRLKTEFETAQKENEIQLLNADKQIQEDEISRRKFITNMLIAGIVVALLLGYFLFNRYRLKRRVEQLDMRNKIAADLHDDIGSTLSSISLYSDMTKMRFGNSNPEAVPMLEKISSNAKETLRTMSEIVWEIRPGNDAFINLEEHIRQFAEEICAPAGITYEFYAENLDTKLKLPMEQRRDIYLVCKEAINNAVKYSGCTAINMTFARENNHIRIHISDNGKGFDVKKIMKGNGLQTMKQRIHKNNGAFTIDSNFESGTSINFSVPIP